MYTGSMLFYVHGDIGFTLLALDKLLLIAFEYYKSLRKLIISRTESSKSTLSKANVRIGDKIISTYSYRTCDMCSMVYLKQCKDSVRQEDGKCINKR